MKHLGHRLLVWNERSSKHDPGTPPSQLCHLQGGGKGPHIVLRRRYEPAGALQQCQRNMSRSSADS